MADQADIDAEALIEAIIALRVNHPEATAKEYHALLPEQNAKWMTVSFGDVKKAASKAAKRVARQQESATPPSSSIIGVGQHLRLHSLKQRTDINGFNAVVVPCSSDGEMTELQQKGRVKVKMLHSDEVLSIAESNSERITAANAEQKIYSSKNISVAHVPGRDFGMHAERQFSHGQLIFREDAIASSWELEDHVHDPQVISLMQQVEAKFGPDGEDGEGDPELMQRIMIRITELDFKSAPAREQNRWMSLCDSFSTPPTKTPFDVYRSNALGKEDVDGKMGGYLYDLLCRANHSCAPNISKTFDGASGSISVVALKAIAKGDELLMCYLPDEMDKSTKVRREHLKEKYNFTCTCERCGPVTGPIEVA